MQLHDENPQSSSRTGLSRFSWSHILSTALPWEPDAAKKDGAPFFCVYEIKGKGKRKKEEWEGIQWVWTDCNRKLSTTSFQAPERPAGSGGPRGDFVPCRRLVWETEDDQ
ncbi:unnamed protein product [Pleuronectes platessa]|uniref:Uncharacterized protein n=1 Tax=Pleuronectes platessa TaxID=8262 RepID=A0A9N7U4Q6_PLEPL|nr:unnamed protein product [Pleuronectes platessa]